MGTYGFSHLVLVAIFFFFFKNLPSVIISILTAKELFFVFVGFIDDDGSLCC